MGDKWTLERLNLVENARAIKPKRKKLQSITSRDRMARRSRPAFPPRFAITQGRLISPVSRVARDIVISSCCVVVYSVAYEAPPRVRSMPAAFHIISPCRRR